MYFCNIGEVLQRSIVMWEVAILKDSHKSLTDYEDYFNQNIELFSCFLMALITIWHLSCVPLGILNKDLIIIIIFTTLQIEVLSCAIEYLQTVIKLLIQFKIF